MYGGLLWGFVIIGGPILLGLALLWARWRSSRAEKVVDPETPSDDPSKGMIGHDVPETESAPEDAYSNRSRTPGSDPGRPL